MFSHTGVLPGFDYEMCTNIGLYVTWVRLCKHLKDITSRLSTESCSQKKLTIALFFRFRSF